ncbi:MAG TPA: NADP-dependent isocitrate dehydrogenase [Terriglobales bacterium]|nr:NADP-dependent isocitrate dehydrogenase [Terriglobales bacterium]
MAESYNGLPVPAEGQRINYNYGKYDVPDNPIIPFIEGDGTGRDIWKASVRVFDAAVEKAYRGRRKVVWYEIFAGEKAMAKFNSWLPDGTIEAMKSLRVGIKGPLTTPVGGGIRSLNVALRQILDLYACVRPVKWYGAPSPVKRPDRMNLIIFRENTEDVYAGIEWQQGTEKVKKLIEFLNNEMLAGTGKKVREDSGVGIKPISVTGTTRLVRRAIQHALEKGLKSVTLVHKGNIQKFTEGAFRQWGYDVAVTEFRDNVVTERESWILDNKDRNPDITVEQNAHMIEPGLEFATPEFRETIYKEVRDCLESIYATHGNGGWKNKLLINDRIADSIFQQVVTRADEYQVLATPNLNGDYISDACAAQIGGLGIAPGANIGDGYAMFEATHGTAPKYADLDVINPGSVMLSGAMMFDFLGWSEAARLIEDGIRKTIDQKKVTYDFHRLMEGATKVKCSEFGDYIIKNMDAASAAVK